MKSFLQKISQWIDRPFAQLDMHDLISHPIKRAARRSLGAGMGLSIVIHFVIIGSVILYMMYGREKEVELRMLPHPLFLNMIDPSELITSETGGGGGGAQKEGGEKPPEPGEEILSKGTPVPVEIGIPVPVPDMQVAEAVTIATQEEMEKDIAYADETDEESTDQVGLTDAGGGGTGEGGIGGGVGSGGGGGDGTPGTWRYDTPPNPRRLITMLESKNLPKKLRNIDGMMKFRLLIDEFGKVIDARITDSSGHQELDDLALTVIYKFSFNPATFQGRTVKAWINFGYGFRTRKK